MSAKPDESNRPAQPSQAQEDGRHKQPIQAQPVQGQSMQAQPIQGQLTQVQPMQAQPMQGQSMQAQPIPYPITSQPMQAAAWTGDGPQGLQHLSQLNQIWIKREMNYHWCLEGCQANYEYQILNAMGQQIYEAKEESNCCTVMCVPFCNFNVTIKDYSGQEVSQLFH